MSTNFCLYNSLHKVHEFNINTTNVFSSEKNCENLFIYLINNTLTIFTLAAIIFKVYGFKYWCNVFYLRSFIVKTSPNAQNCVSVLRVSNSFATLCASKRYLVRRISLSTIMKRQPTKRIEVLAFVIAAALYACGLRPVSNHLSHNYDAIKLKSII